METQSAKIEIPKGYEIDQVDNRSGEVTFKKKPENIMAKIESINDAIETLGEEDTEVIMLRKLQQIFDTSNHLVNYQTAVVFTKALNEGWTPDWNIDSQYKFFPYFYMGGSSGFRSNGYGSWGSLSDVGSRLAFKSRELAEYAGKQFTEVYKQFMTI